MAATLTGTPVAIVWASGADPAGQSITIPADCTAVYLFWSFYANTTGAGLLTATLNGSSFAEAVEFPVNTGSGSNATGVCAWYNPATGSRTLDVSWDAAVIEGPTSIVVFVKGGDTTGWRDADAIATAISAAANVTLTTVAGDLVLKHDQQYQGIPANTSGWTSELTQSVNNNEGARLASISASGTTQACPCEGENFSSVAAIAIIAGAGGGGGEPYPASEYKRRRILLRKAA